MDKRERVARAYCARIGVDPEEEINFGPLGVEGILKRWQVARRTTDEMIADYLAALAEEEPSEAEVEAAYGAFRAETGDLTEALTAALRAARKARMG